jgi:hypothetical protein
VNGLRLHLRSLLVPYNLSLVCSHFPHLFCAHTTLLSYFKLDYFPIVVPRRRCCL